MSTVPRVARLRRAAIRVAEHARGVRWRRAAPRVGRPREEERRLLGRGADGIPADPLRAPGLGVAAARLGLHAAPEGRHLRTRSSSRVNRSAKPGPAAGPPAPAPGRRHPRSLAGATGGVDGGIPHAGQGGGDRGLRSEGVERLLRRERTGGASFGRRPRLSTTRAASASKARESSVGECAGKVLAQPRSRSRTSVALRIGAVASGPTPVALADGRGEPHVEDLVEHLPLTGPAQSAAARPSRSRSRSSRPMLHGRPASTTSLVPRPRRDHAARGRRPRAGCPGRSMWGSWAAVEWRCSGRSRATAARSMSSWCLSRTPRLSRTRSGLRSFLAPRAMSVCAQSTVSATLGALRSRSSRSAADQADHRLDE